MDRYDVNVDLLLNILEESLNPMACVRVLDYDEEKSIQFMMLNKAFRAMYGEEASRAMQDATLKLSEIEEFNAEDDLSRAILDVYESEKEVIRHVDMKGLHKIFNMKAYMPLPGYICLSFADVTESERAKNDALENVNAISTNTEKLKFEVDRLTAGRKQLEDNARVYELIAQVSNDGFYFKDYQNDSFVASDSWYDLFTIDGNKPRDCQDVASCLSDNDVFEYNRAREKAICEGCESMNSEFRLADDRTWLEGHFHFSYNPKGELVEEIAYFKNISMIKSQKEELAYKAYYDGATGLINRTYMNKLLENDLARAAREDVAVSVLYVDIDDFKNVNDSIGYKLADEFLIKFAMILKNYQSSSVRLARFDSDEFVLSLYDSTRHSAQKIAIEIKKRLLEPIVLSNGMSQHMTVSIGINEFPFGGSNAVDLIANADIALHVAKNNGKNGIVFYEEKMLNEFMNKIEMENNIKSALENDRFQLFYQPQFATTTKKLRGMEALIRMRDEEYGLLLPQNFIPLAEHNGSIVDIGEWVIRKAFEDYKNWQENYDFDGIMSINISPVQFKSVTFESTLYALIREYHMDPSHVEIEITESLILDNKFQVTEMLKRIRNQGIRISLDDFGTGYSSLAYLYNIPMDTLKIDKSFIDSLGEERNADIITSSVIEMVQKLGIELVAEGVETQAQFEFLKKIDCDNIQGYYLAKPMSSEGIKSLIREA